MHGSRGSYIYMISTDVHKVSRVSRAYIMHASAFVRSRESGLPCLLAVAPFQHYKLVTTYKHLWCDEVMG